MAMSPDGGPKARTAGSEIGGGYVWRPVVSRLLFLGLPVLAPMGVVVRSPFLRGAGNGREANDHNRAYGAGIAVGGRRAGGNVRWQDAASHCAAQQGEITKDIHMDD